MVVRLLLQDLPSVEGSLRDRPPFEPTLSTLDGLLATVESGRIAKEGIPAVLTALATGAPDIGTAVEREGLSGFTAENLDALVERVVRANVAMVRERGEEAFSPLMGDVMREVRGRRDGKEVAEVLRRTIARLRAEDVP